MTRRFAAAKVRAALADVAERDRERNAARLTRQRVYQARWKAGATKRQERFARATA